MPRIRLPRRALLLALASAAALAGCAKTGEQSATQAAREPIGEFKLGYAIVVADNVQKVQPSRDVSVDEWEAALKTALNNRFSGYTGSQFYHVAVNVLGYSVAVPGVPVVLAPKSVVVLEATIWDDAKQGKINETPRQFTIFESASPEFVIGTGLTRDKSEQVADLSANAAAQIEAWMRENPYWFAKK